MFAYPTSNHSQFPITLPPIEEFGRPVWAYNHLGWDVLRRLLFGETEAMLGEIARHGAAPLTSHQLEQMLRYYKVHDTVRSLIVQFGAGQPASMIHEFYEEWENLTFENYVNQVKNRGR